MMKGVLKQREQVTIQPQRDQVSSLKSQTHANLFLKQIGNGPNDSKPLKGFSDHMEGLNNSGVQNSSILSGQVSILMPHNGNTSEDQLQNNMRTRGGHSFSSKQNNITISSNNNMTQSQGKILSQQMNASSAKLHSLSQQKSSSQYHQLNNSRGSVSFASKGNNNNTSNTINNNTNNINYYNTNNISNNNNTNNQKKTFYHHTNIYNLKQYKNLTDYIIEGGDIDEVKNHQRRLLIREFRHKVDQYLLSSKYRKEQATKEFNNYYTRIQDQLFHESQSQFNATKEIFTSSQQHTGGVSFLSQGQQLQQQQYAGMEDGNQSLSNIQAAELNKSMLRIDANRFNYSKLSKQEAALINSLSVDIYLEDNYGQNRLTTRAIDKNKLQDMILDKISPLINQEAQYDQKIEHFTKEYERVLQKIQTKQFKIKIPSYYEAQMQPYNEFYNINYSKKQDLKDAKDDSSLPWNEIDDQLLNQVLMQDEQNEEEVEDDGEEGDDERDQGEYEDEQEEEIQEEIVEEDKGNENEKIVKVKAKPLTNGIQGVEMKIRPMEKVVKKGNRTQKMNLKAQLDNQLQQSQQQSKQSNASGKSTERKYKERSAIDEYVSGKPLTPPQPRKKPQQNQTAAPIQQTQPVKKKSNTPIEKTAQPATALKQSGVTPKAEVSQRQDPNEINKEQSAEEKIQEDIVVEQIKDQQPKQQQSSQSSQQQSTSSHKEAAPSTTLLQSTNTPKTKIPSTTAIPIKISSSAQIPLQKVNNEVPNEDSNQKKLVAKIADRIKEEKVQLIAKEQHILESKIEEEVKLQKQDSSQDIKVRRRIVKKDDDEDDEEEDEDIEEEKKKNKSGIAGTPQGPAQARQSDAFKDHFDTEMSYFHNSKMRRRVGTGIIDELVKINYLLEFNMGSYKKERRAPDLPRDLEFKGEEDRSLFDSIFQWQYEIDLDIEEMEEKLNNKQNDNNNRNKYSSDDDDNDGEGKQNDKNSARSSEITDFGPAPPLRESFNDIPSDELSDIE